MRANRAIGLALAVTFAAVGLVFFCAPGSVATFLEQVSRLAPLPALPADDVRSGLFRVLAAAYMYLVAWFAWMIFRRPDESVWPAVLAQAKLASAALSLVLMVIQGPSLVLVVNGVVDGLLGMLALWLRQQTLGRRSGGQVVAS